MAGENNTDDKRSQSDKERDERRALEQAQREDRRAKEQAARDERRAKEAATRERTKGKTPKGTLEKNAAREEARKYDIDTKGMSTKEIKSAVSDAKKVEEDMMKFIEKSLGNFTTKKGDSVSPSNSPVSTTSRITEDKPSPITPVGGTPRSKGGGGSDIPLPPSQGVYILGAENGQMRWFETDQC
jgi:hypothetical protein